MLQVTCAIIEHNNKVLICQRSATMKLPMKWEFPGGKIEQDESKEDCLQREIKEELGMIITIDRALKPVEYQYPDFSICLYPFICRWESGQVVPTEHKQAIWVDASELLNYDWAEADLPIVREYLSL
ncbi:(deoxy)nucleoside triphosphate pyrophosphohydrolase [Sphingobacterium sp. UDSM-2020]|uniref:(deoxy)nucleoside triphosphate pyrophosphohydrolase n=1 Tax=Sphingobacterium sp. UDSM-2020 TaxID=2795738 RepID=UPI0019367743|nr:(deoxy)nucleoside triphosphate pyrophosphohydrolase [Sphingobacterium sp. UDSM-2020]QQD13399.1 (deoxy)nucleoside triphosphate pyrophosphohydrolase [Sphingobacterium sp. UDSM-2020]